MAIAIPFSLSWITYNPLVQTFLARMAASYLSDRMETVIRIDGLYITPRLDLHLTGVLALDQRSDTLFNAEDIFIDIKSLRLQQEKKIFEINDVSISDASFALIKGRHDSVFSYSFIRDHFESTSDPVIDTNTVQPTWQVSLQAIALEKVRFRYIDENRDPIEVGMDYQNLDIFVNSLHIQDLKIRNDTFNLTINNLSCRDRCGFVVNEFSGDFRLSPLFLIADNLIIKTPRSDLDLDLAFNYNGWNSYVDFVDKVDMAATIRPSEFNLKDAGYFASEILVMDNQLRIGGDVIGKVNNLRVKDFRFAFGKNTHFFGDVRLYGLPDVRETYIHTKIEELIFTQSDLTQFAIPGSSKHIPAPTELKKMGRININGSFTGFYNDFVSTAVFKSELGTFTTDVSLRQNKDHSDVIYKGVVSAERFDIGKLLEMEDFLGRMDLNGTVDGHGITASTVNLNMVGNVDSLEFMGNTFNEVGISGDIADKKFNGHLNVKDDLLNMVFNGILDFNQEKPIFNFLADIHDADLYKLNLMDRDSTLLLSLKLDCNFIGSELDEMEGRIRIDSLDYTEGNKNWFMNHLALISLKEGGYYNKLMITSDILDANINGNYSYRELPYSINQIIIRELPAWSFMPEPPSPIRVQNLDFSITINESADILDIFAPGLIIQNPLNISGKLDSEEMSILADVSVPSLKYRGVCADSLSLHARSDTGMIGIGINTKNLLLKDRGMNDTLQLGLERFGLGFQLANDSMNYSINWDDRSETDNNKADIRGYYTYVDSIGNIVHLTKSDVVINGSPWTINRSNKLIFRENYYAFSKLLFDGGNQHLGIDGIISQNAEDSLTVNFIDWKASNFDILYSNYDFDLDGIINGSVGINDIYQSPNFFTNLQIAGLKMNKVLIGDADIQSTWNKEISAVEVMTKIIYQGNVGSSEVVYLNGQYFPMRSEDNLDFTLKLNNFRLEALRSFIDDQVSGLTGIASGDFTVKGSTSAPILTGELKLMRTECRINYLNTKYSLAHSIEFTKNEILFKDLTIFDTIGNQAHVNGSIMHKNLKDFNFYITMGLEDFICLQTDKYQNKTFYGTAIASGTVKFYGPPENFHIDADVETSKGTDLVIPLNNSLTLTDNDFVIFLTEKKEEDVGLQDYNVDLKGLSLDFRIRINNAAEVMIFLPDNMGNISSKGYGDIRFTVNPRGEFNIYGDYNFLRGTFFFTLQNLINRRFEIVQGGKISFTGNPYNANVNLKALYKLKTTLSGLGAAISPEYEGQRVNVNAYLGLRGKLANPDIVFSIGFPNVKEDVRQVIYAILDTNDASLMNQQMISLLIMNSFSYASSSGNVSSSSLNIISGQLSNWLSQISSDFDIGINYIPGDEINQNEVEVALSTQFFNNRLIVDGNVGVMTEDKSQQQASNIVGDVNIEYKLTPDGRIRLRAFNRANNLNSIDYYAPYTQGVAIFYTKEFDRFKDIFRRHGKRGEGNENLENE